MASILPLGDSHKTAPTDNRTRTEYQYTPLPDSIAIRLLEILPGSNNAEVQCRLEIHKLYEAPPYRALSYTWGDPNELYGISLNDANINVRKNLYAFLKQLRHNEFREHIWIDAICINQNDIPERNEQVTIMRNIYEKAEQVIVWLGEEDEESNDAMDFIPVFTSRIESLVSHRVRGHDFAEGLNMDGLAHKFHALAALLRRPWFKRMWIIQEVASAADCIVLCGSRSVSWKTLSCILEHFDSWRQAYNSSNLDVRKGLPDLEVAFLYLQFGCNEALPLYRVLQYHGKDLGYWLDECWQLQCSVKHDEVYAVLGLAGGRARSYITVDYDYSIDKLNQVLTEYFFRAHYSLSVFSRHTGWREWSPLEARPSWVPDIVNSDIPLAQRRSFSSSNRLSTPLYERKERALFAASGPSSHFYRMQLPEIYNDILSLHGIQVDTLTWVCPWEVDRSAPRAERAEAKVPYTTSQPVIAAFKEKLLAQLPDDQYITGISLHEAFWRTILLDNVPAGGTLGASKHSHEPNDGEPSLTRPFANPGRERHPDRIGDRLSSEVRMPPQGAEEEASVVRQCSSNLQESLIHRALFTTQTGYIGLCPTFAEPGDKVCVLFGAEIPYVLREVDKGHHIMIGECYMHGIMDGEAVEDVKKGKQRITEFHLR